MSLVTELVTLSCDYLSLVSLVEINSRYIYDIWVLIYYKLYQFDGTRIAPDEPRYIVRYLCADYILGKRRSKLYI